MLTRREFMRACCVLLAGCAATPAAPGRRKSFVRREGFSFLAGAEPYRFAGANMWYAAYLGADAAYGDRQRLRRELDRLQALGITNVRILGSSELSPLKNSVTPAFRPSPAQCDETLLGGLDLALAELSRRDMTAVIYLTNFWEWSGGMMTYLYWTNGGRYIDMNDPRHPWPEFPDMVADFYSSGPAVRLYREYVTSLVRRINTVSRVRYSDDPTIMGWQLANEPRPGGSDQVGLRQLPAYLSWIGATARLIKSLDPNHLVSTGSEGTQGCLGREDCVAQAHGSPHVDYLTAHVWPQNWGWTDPADLEGSWATVESRTKDYISTQVGIARRLGKPLVIEEFGFPRDGSGLDASSGTRLRDRFFALVYEAVLRPDAEPPPGEGRARMGDGGSLQLAQRLRSPQGQVAEARDALRRKFPSQTASRGDCRCLCLNLGSC